MLVDARHTLQLPVGAAQEWRSQECRPLLGVPVAAGRADRRWPRSLCHGPRPPDAARCPVVLCPRPCLCPSGRMGALGWALDLSAWGCSMGLSRPLLGQRGVPVTEMRPLGQRGDTTSRLHFCPILGLWWPEGPAPRGAQCAFKSSASPWRAGPLARSTLLSGLPRRGLPRVWPLGAGAGDGDVPQLPGEA